jgi:hypothetical protein
MRHDEILRRLVANRVEVIVVGMAAGVLRGAPVTTQDVDVVHRRSGDNVLRLLRVLTEIHAVYRHDPRRLSPDASHLMGPGHQLLTTTYGDFDCLGEIDEGKTYDDLVSVSSEMPIEDLGALRVLELRSLIEIKRRAGRPKDLAALPYLEATLDELDDD